MTRDPLVPEMGRKIAGLERIRMAGSEWAQMGKLRTLSQQVLQLTLESQMNCPPSWLKFKLY